ncbi:MAG: methyltransferase [Defluviitaleaceae bacterium]|nr:methyltransferase [Defluviitaleaceae bacterium]
MTSRKLVLNTLEFSNKTNVVPRQLWELPWASIYHGEALKKIREDFPPDIDNGPPASYGRPTGTGDPYEPGIFIDAWGCRFVNIQRGVFGEVKEPIIPQCDAEWDDMSRVRFPVEWLEFDADEVNRYCRASDKFIIAAANPRPFEQLQFMRGSEQLFVDLMLKPPKMMAFIKKMHAFYCELLEKWAKTEVDALTFMDDWGAQHSLLVNPREWREIFGPMYKDYVSIAHSNGKKLFMHSDGYTLEILSDLIEMGLDAINAQIFCIGIESLAVFKGKITFWGEMDRQHLLPAGTINEVRAAVRRVAETLWDSGGCIAQCEFGAGARPENVRAMFEEWKRAIS